MPDAGASVAGLLLHDVDPDSLRALDAYEEGYVRRRVRVRVGEAEVEAEVYVPSARRPAASAARRLRRSRS